MNGTEDSAPSADALEEATSGTSSSSEHKPASREAVALVDVRDENEHGGEPEDARLKAEEDAATTAKAKAEDDARLKAEEDAATTAKAKAEEDAIESRRGSFCCPGRHKRDERY